MTKYAVFLRGINVGGRVVKMVDLKTCLESIDLKEVKTLLQSGNVVFETNKAKDLLKPMIEASLTRKFNYPAKVQVYDMATLKDVINRYPFGEAGVDAHDYVIFLENCLEKSIILETYVLESNEKVKAGEGVVYWRVYKGSTLKSSFAKLLSKPSYKYFNTNRNIKTLKKLVNL